MNSVFSAFKSSKSDGSLQSNKGKKIGPANSSSYANLRHIREIGSSAKMSSFVGNNDDDDIAPNLRLTKCTALHSNDAVANTINNSVATTGVATLVTTTTSTPPSSPSSSSSLSTSSMEHIIPQEATTKSNLHQNECDTSNTIKTMSDSISGSSHVNIDTNHTIHSVAKDATTALSIEQVNVPLVKPINSQSVANYASNIPSNGIQSMDIDHSSLKACENNKENNDIINPSTNTSDAMCDSDSTAHVSNGVDNRQRQVNHDNNVDGHNVNDIDDDVNDVQKITTSTNEMPHTPVLSAASNKKLNRHSETTAPTTSNKSTSNRFFKRLSLSGISSNPLPSVHGRSASNSQNGNQINSATGETKRTRISTHQRNLSLDFR